jgi:hypothetical protein
MAADSSMILSGLRLAGGASASMATTENRPLTFASDIPLPPMAGGSNGRRTAYTYCRYMQLIVLKHPVLSRGTPASAR